MVASALRVFPIVVYGFESKSIAFPFEWISLEPVVPVREATVDLVDEGNKFVVHAEMPGVAKDKIDVALTKDGIEISAETDVEKEDKEKNFVVGERVYSHIYKQLSFPEEVILRKLNPHLGTDYLKSASQRRRLHQPLKSTKSQ